ncbi:hypothetical protein [Geminocystis sp. NIES-3709]|nr:hypothetical protein [Geminocystis sp. NIES-3709]BAQ66941.1 hypothetical protein GM3709_3706 [Geminocystis sp. NIES-3709]
MIKSSSEQGLGVKAIAQKLKGKFYTKRKFTNWAEVQVRRVLAEVKG